MPIKGRRPSGEGVSNNRHAPVHAWIEVEDTPHRGGPALPKTRPNGTDWSERVRRKWSAWRTLPHARLWRESDWSFAIDTAEVAELFYAGLSTAATELRQREAILGTTLDTRRDLRIRYVPAKPQQLAEVVIADDYREL